VKKRVRNPHLVKPSALPQTLLTVSAVCLFSVILRGAPVDVVLSVVRVTIGFAAKISAGFNDD
jgi:hypothetical protein